jgi:hypothetical protein
MVRPDSEFDIDHDLACGDPVLDRGMGVGHLSELEAVGVQDGCHLTGFGKLCGFAQDFAVVRPALPGQHRQQCGMGIKARLFQII